MHLERLAAQLLWCGWGEAPEPQPRTYNDHARYLVEELGVGGLVLFTRNLGTPAEVAELVATLRAHSAAPPLIGIDQEGGRVSRLPLPGMVFPGNMALGKLNRLEETRAVHRALGEQLAALGIDVDFAPVLDANNNPANPIIGVRSFGEDAELVARHGVAAVAGFHEAGVLPVVKHFPGHGDTQSDSHLELPRQPAERARLDAVELVPFRAALAAEPALAVMTTHILFAALDAELPSTLSPRIINGLLREELGFDGLVVTDCLEMKGIADHWGPEEAAVLAVEAGADMLLVCHTQETQTRMHAALCNAVREGRLTEERLAQSLARIERVRAATATVRNGTPDPSVAGSERYRRLEARLARECLQYWDDGRYTPASALPAGWDPKAPVLVAGASGVAESLAEQIRELGGTAEAMDWMDGEVERLAEAAQVVWVAVPHDPVWGTPPPTHAEVLARHLCAVVVAVREPYCLAQFPRETTRVAAWGSQPVHLRAVAGWLTGEPAP